MTVSGENSGTGLQAALELYGDFLRRPSARAPGAFDALCEEHPALAEHLRRLHGIGALAQSLAGSAPFHHSLREVFGEEAEVKLTLDEGEASEENKATLVDAGAVPLSEATSGVPAVDRYALQGEVARGGMGIIYKVRDRELNRTLAMKVMLGTPSLAHRMGEGRGEGFRATGGTSHPLLTRFLEEVQVTAQLDHPGIVAVHELGLDAAGRPYFTMKLVKGRDLSRIFELARADQEGWNVPRAIGALIKACQAVAFAHTKGVIHRDLKPANVMVGRFGEVYVMDWGLAKVTGRNDLHDLRLAPASQNTVTEIQTLRGASGSATADSPLITMDGSVVGTPAYMPPEQAKGQVEQVDAQSDIYSLGAILYNLLTGQAPYVEPGARLSPHTILARVLDGPPKRIHTLNRNAPAELVAICEKAMAREKRDRYPSSLDLAEDLQAYLDNRVVKAYRTGAVAEFKSWFARNRTTALVTTGAVAVVMGVLLFGAVWERTKAFKLKESLARQYLRHGQGLCEQGEMARGLHWLARSLKEAPELSRPLRDVIQQNLSSWGQQWKRPRAVLLHDTAVVASVLSPDGKRAITCNYNRVVQFWSAETGEALPLKLKFDDPVGAVSFSPDGTRLLTATAETVRIWNSETGEPVGSLMKHDSAVVLAVFSPDGKRVAAAGQKGTVRLWSAATGAPIGAPMAHEGEVHSVAFSPDGRQLLTCGADKTARLWNSETGEPIASPMRHPDKVWRAVFSRDAKHFATSCADHIVRLWSASTGEPKGVPIVHHGVLAIVFSLDGQRLATVGQDRAVRFWNASTGEPIGIPLIHDDAVTDVVFGADGRQILTGSTDGTVRFWSSETGEPLGAPLRHDRGAVRLMSSTDGQTVLVSLYDNHAPALWKVQPENQRGLVFPRTLHIGALTFTPDGRRLLVGDDNGECWWCSVETGEAMRSTLRHKESIWSVALSPDGKRALTASTDKTARLWSLEGGERLLWIFAHDSDVRSAVFSADGRLVATASFDRTARLWSAENGQPVGKPLSHPKMVEDVAFSPDGALLATACGDGAARLWSVKTAQQIGPVMRHRSMVLGVTFSPDSKQLVTASSDKTARFWSVATGRPTGLVLEHRADVDDARFSPDGKRLVTGCTGEDSIRLWSAGTGELLGPPLEESTYAAHVEFSPDGTRIAASREGRPTRLWTVPQVFQGDLRQAELWVQVLTWQEMDDHGVLTWLDRETWKAHRDQLEKLGGPAIPSER